MCIQSVYADDILDEQSILFINGSHANLAKIKLLKRSANKVGFNITVLSAASLVDNNATLTAFNQHSLVVFDGVSSRDNKNSFARFLPLLPQSSAQFMAMADTEGRYLNKLTSAMAKTITRYYRNGGEQNFIRLADYFYYRVLNNNQQKSILDPIIYPSVGIYHPDYEGLVFNTRQQYLTWLTQREQTSNAGKSGLAKPTVGLLIQRASIETIQTSVIDETIKKIEAQGARVLPFFFELSPFASDYTALLQDKDETVVDIIINFRMIHWANKRKTEFEKLGVPVLQALTYFDGDQQKWEQDIQGVSPGMMPFTLVLPETAGVIDPLIIATFSDAVQSGDMSETVGVDDAGEHKVIDYQLEHLVTKALRMVNLKYKVNADKKITVMVWGDEDIGASFLNVPDSLHTLAHRLHGEGYNIEPFEHEYYSDRAKAILEPFFRDDRLGEKLDQLVADDLADWLPIDDYMQWFNRLPQKIRQPVMDYWGHPKDSFMAKERDGKHYLIMPRIHNGNMLVMRQPPRADDKDEAERIYHDETVPINHFYLAAYYYAREYWNSDAIVHYGTHGSQEYLYGKERVPSIYDHPNLAVWDTPILYPFIVDDVGEAMQTKRRGRATVISHMTPPFAAAGLQGDLSDIHNMMHEYNALDDGGVKVKTGQNIVEKCFESNICVDMQLNREIIKKDFSGFLAQLHSYMNEISGMSQPLGLHSFGELPRKELVISTLVQMLGSEFVSAAAKFEQKFYQAAMHDDSHQHSGEAAHSHAANNQLEHSHDGLADGDHGFHEVQSEISQLAGFKTVRDYVVLVEDEARGESLDQHSHSDNTHQHAQDDEHQLAHTHSDKAPVALKKLPKILQDFIQQGQEYYRNMLAIKELDNTVAFLNGKYIPVKTGGDPLRHPESLPTGLNLYGFDPSRIPTKAAYEQGSELVEKIIADYYAKHGNYPDKLAFSLWSIETMRQYGVLEAQALAAMGMKPVWSPDGRVVDSEIIPYAELKRPRVDVVLSTTGLYRDAFPNIMQYLAKAIEKIAVLKEEGNNVWKNSQRIAKELKEQGIEADEAKYLSSVRLFSNAPGQHGSGVDDATFASDTWDSDKNISDVYLNRMGYYYGSDNTRYGKRLKDINLYATQLSGTDIALHSRSSNLYGMLSTDDPFEYFGALSLAVRNIDGQSPEMIISNLRDANKPKAENAEQFLSKELRTRNFHPRWISEMMKEGYSGAVEMSGRIDNFWGWQVVDPNIVRADQWQTFFDVYIDDSLNLDIQEFFEKVNPNAQARMLERMLEAVRKDYWQADKATVKKMLERYIDIVERFDHYVDNQKLREFVDQGAAGFGLNMQLPAPQVATENTTPSQAVEGQKLEKVEQSNAQTDNKDWTLLIVALVIIGLIGIGAVNQKRQFTC